MTQSAASAFSKDSILTIKINIYLPFIFKINLSSAKIDLDMGSLLNTTC